MWTRSASSPSSHTGSGSLGSSKGRFPCSMRSCTDMEYWRNCGALASGTGLGSTGHSSAPAIEATGRASHLLSASSDSRNRPTKGCWRTSSRWSARNRPASGSEDYSSSSQGSSSSASLLRRRRSRCCHACSASVSYVSGISVGYRGRSHAYGRYWDAGLSTPRVLL